MSFDTGFREKISDYVTGKITAADLGDWISIETWDLDERAPASAQQAYDALRLIAEAENGGWTDDQLRQHLQSLAGILTDEDQSVPVSPSPSGEQFLERLSLAERKKPRAPETKQELHAAVMRYAGFGITLRWSETGRSNDPEFLRQPRAESDTPDRAQGEVVAG